MTNVVTPERYASGMTFDEYVQYIGTPENLARDSAGGPRLDYSAFFREAFEKLRLTGDQEAALKWLVAQPNGPARMHVDRVVAQLRQAKPGESPEQAQARSGREYPALQASEFFRIWASAAVDEIISALHRRLLLGTV